MWRDPRHNRWQQRVNKQAKRAAERDDYLTGLDRGNRSRWSATPMATFGSGVGYCDRGPCCLQRGHEGPCLR